MTGRLAVAMLNCIFELKGLVVCDPQTPVGAACIR